MSLAMQAVRLPGLAADFAKHREAIDESKKKRDAQPKLSP